MSELEKVPEDFTRFVIEGVERVEDGLILRYGGRIFGGVMIDLMEEDVAAAIRPGVEIFVRYHTAETGHAGQVAHMLIRHPNDGGWAEIYADWE